MPKRSGHLAVHGVHFLPSSFKSSKYSPAGHSIFSILLLQALISPWFSHIMISETEAIAFGELIKDTIYSIDFSQKGQIIIKDEKDSFKLTQFSKDFKNRDYSSLVNQRIMSGELLLDGNVVKFESSGEIVGLDSIVKYSFHENYYDAGMQVDMIYLSYIDNRPEETFGYSLSDSTFNLYNLNCVENDEEYDYCLVRELGEPYLKFKRKN